ncbi:MAG TPA: hypothetical protein VEC35_25270 [Noviherbaspirillum sp.]|nr:hypothetical protein [Noviherbaspirillum sp.]
MKKILTMTIALGLVFPNAFAQVTSPAQPAAGVETSGAPATSGGASGAPQDTSSGSSNVMTTEAGADLPPPPSPIARLKPVTHDDVAYLCGGVGEEESTYMKREAKDYDLMLTFATRKGEYLADVDVDILDAKGNTVLQMACDSPILLVDLPQGGSYRVKAETAGYALNRTVRVAGGKRQAPKVASTVLSWPQTVAEAGGAGVTATGSSGDSGESKSRSGPR